MSGDTYNNCVSDDGFEYVTLNDTNGFDLASGSGANQMLGKFTSESPLIGANVNWLPAYGAARAQMGSDYSTAKSSGLYCLRGSIYMITQRVGAFNGSGGVKHISAQIIKSQDHGRTWNNFQSPNVYNSNGIMTNPADATSFASTTLFGASTFVMYGVDDYTLGYRVDNADAYVYIMGNDGYWNNGNNLYLARIPRSKLTNLNPADIQYYRGGDGIYDSAWSSSIQATQAVLSSAGKLSQPAVQYVPALNRYILFEWYYPNSIQASQANSAYTQWITYEAPHPWGPWRLIDNRSWLKEGYYGPVPLQRSALNGTTMKVLTTGNYNANWSGYPNLLTSFSYQIFSSTIQLQTGSTVSAPY